MSFCLRLVLWIAAQKCSQSVEINFGRINSLSRTYTSYSRIETLQMDFVEVALLLILTDIMQRRI